MTRESCRHGRQRSADGLAVPRARPERCVVAVRHRRVRTVLRRTILHRFEYRFPLGQWIAAAWQRLCRAPSRSGSAGSAAELPHLRVCRLGLT